MTKLVRDNLRNSLRAANEAHPGLLLQRGWTDFVKTDADNVGEGGKTEHLARICKIPTPTFYENAFNRWKTATSDKSRFLSFEIEIVHRLLIGLTGGGALETGCAISQTYGMPYLPGSSIKGMARAYAESLPNANKSVLETLFGCEPDDVNESGLSGVVAFHDAWWSGDKKPFVMDVVTPHHPDYYGNEGKTPATDLDSPVPNAVIGVQGSFHFTLEGDPNWIKLAKTLVERAMAENGIGAKTAAGYGYGEKTKDKALGEKVSNFVPAKLKKNPGSGDLTAILSEGKPATLTGEAARRLLEKLPEEQRNGKKIKDGILQVEICIGETGNQRIIKDLRAKPAA